MRSVSRTRCSVLSAMPTGRANARPMTGSASSGRCTAKPGPKAMRSAQWTPDQQRTAIARRNARERAYGAAQHPGHAFLILGQRRVARLHQPRQNL
jgi:hypothetical protein